MSEPLCSRHLLPRGTQVARTQIPKRQERPATPSSAQMINGTRCTRWHTVRRATAAAGREQSTRTRERGARRSKQRATSNEQDAGYAWRIPPVGFRGCGRGRDRVNRHDLEADQDASRLLDRQKKTNHNRRPLSRAVRCAWHTTCDGFLLELLLSGPNPISALRMGCQSLLPFSPSGAELTSLLRSRLRWPRRPDGHRSRE